MIKIYFYLPDFIDGIMEQQIFLLMFYDWNDLSHLTKCAVSVSVSVSISVKKFLLTNIN